MTAATTDTITQEPVDRSVSKTIRALNVEMNKKYLCLTLIFLVLGFSFQSSSTRNILYQISERNNDHNIRQWHNSNTTT